MIFINLWAFYDPDDVPDLNPHSDEEMVGDIEKTPDWSIPGRLAVLLDYSYKSLLYKFEK